MTRIERIIGKEDARQLHEDLNALLDEKPTYTEVEDLLLSYGLEMDYLTDLLCL